MKLSVETIAKLASKPKVKKIAVENFLSTLDTTMSGSEHIGNLYADAKAYKWNIQTIEAIKQGLRIAGYHG